MKNMFLGICFLVSIPAASQSLSGFVTDSATGQPIAGATVEVRDGSTLSNDQGYFEFRKLPQDQYRLRITSIGYMPFEKEVSVPATIQATLGRRNLMMEAVEIKAIRAPGLSPFTKTNITKAQIEDVNLGQDLPFLVNQTPSVVVNSDAGNGIGYTGIRIRGSDATRINVTLNGIPYNDAESQGTFFVDLPDLASSVNSIQIQRGVGTSSNGAGAFGATINISTNEVNTEPYVEFNNSFGSFNTWKHTAKVGTGLIADHFTFDVRASKVSSDGYIDRASTDLKSLYASAAYLTSSSAFRFNVITGKEKTYQAWNGVSESDLKTNRTINYAGMEKPGTPYENETDNYRQDHYQLFLNHRFRNHITFQTALFLTRGKGYYEQYKADQLFADYGLPVKIVGSDTINQSDLIRQLWLDNYFFGQIFSASYATSRDQVAVGGGWNRYNGKHFGDVIWTEAGITSPFTWYDLDADKTDVNGYLKYQRQLLSNFYAFGDVQIRSVNYDIRGFRDHPGLSVSKQYTFFNPKVGFTYANKGSKWYVSYARANKEPNRDDFEAGINELPVPETLNDVEIGYEKTSANYSFGATGYWMNYTNQLVLTGEINDVGAYTRSNIPHSYRLGIELQGSVRFNPWLRFDANAAFSRNRIKDFTEYVTDYDDGTQKSIQYGETDISFSPSAVIGSTITVSPWKASEINLYSKYVGRQYLDNTSNTARSLDPYMVHDLRLSYGVETKLIKAINFVFMVNNLFDRKYEPNGYTFSYYYGGELITENYYFPMAGRNFMAAVNVRLAK